VKPLPPGSPDSFRPRFRVTVPLVLVRVPGVGDAYRLDYHYQGETIPWLSDEQETLFLEHGFVERIGGAEDQAPEPAAEPVDLDAVTDPDYPAAAPGPVSADPDVAADPALAAALAELDAPADAPAEPGATSDVVTACVAAMDSLGLPRDTGAPTARAALRGGGHRYGNDTLAAAVRSRKTQQKG
jgi:hypothetical protein